MKNDNTQENRRGSSPPFEDPEHDFYDWLKGLRPVGQRDERVSVNQIAGRPGFEKTTFTDPSFGGAGQGRDDESRWCEDGAKGEEAA